MTMRTECAFSGPTRGCVHSIHFYANPLVIIMLWYREDGVH